MPRHATATTARAPQPPNPRPLSLRGGGCPKMCQGERQEVSHKGGRGFDFPMTKVLRLVLRRQVSDPSDGACIYERYIDQSCTGSLLESLGQDRSPVYADGDGEPDPGRHG